MICRHQVESDGGINVYTVFDFSRKSFPFFSFFQPHKKIVVYLKNMFNTEFITKKKFLIGVQN